MSNDDLKMIEEIEKPQGLAMELLHELKEQNNKFDRHNKRLIAIIIILIMIVTGISIYHEYQWSKFDTVVVDSKDGGNASFIGHDGDVNNNGKSSSTQTETK
jgi:cell division protein FtsL